MPSPDDTTKCPICLGPLDKPGSVMCGSRHQAAAPTADALAWEDARLFGSGYVMVFPDGRRERIPPEAVRLDRAELLKAQEEANDGQ